MANNGGYNLTLLPNNIFTCESSGVPDVTSQCRGLVFYPAGRVMSNATQDMIPSDWSFNLLEWDKQELSATALVDSIMSSTVSDSVNLDTCRQAAKTFACAVHFPYCPYANGGVSHIPLCKDECLALKKQCQLDAAVDCSAAAGFRHDQCFKIPDQGNFLLSTNVGPYIELPFWYSLIACVWAVLFCGWVWALVRKGWSTGTRFQRVMSIVPLLKLSIVGAAASFWVGCEHDGLCSFWLGVFWVNMQLIYETSFILIFLLLSKGWCVTNEHLTRLEWRSVLMSVCIFYMAESMLLVFKSYMAWSYWLFTAMLYASFIVSVFRSVSDHVKVLRRQLDHADQERLNVLAQLIMRKLFLLRIFQYTLIGYSFFELVTHCIIDVATKQLNTALVFHEWMEIVVAIVLAIICAPDVTSRVYYQGLGPVLNQNQRVIPFFKVTLNFGYTFIQHGDKAGEERILQDKDGGEDQNENENQMNDEMTLERVVTATTDEAGGLHTFGITKDEEEEQTRERSTQKSKHVRRLSFKRRLSKRSSVASTSSLRSNLVNDIEQGGEMKSEGHSRNASTASVASTTSVRRPASPVVIRPVHRPAWMFVKRDVDQEDDAVGGTDRSTLVIVQNPSRCDIQMAARISQSRGSYIFGAPSPVPPRSRPPPKPTAAQPQKHRRGATQRRQQEEESDGESDGSDSTDNEEDDEVLMRGRGNSSDGRGSTTIEMTELSQINSVVPSVASRRHAPPPPPPPLW